MRTLFHENDEDTYEFLNTYVTNIRVQAGEILLSFRNPCPVDPNRKGDDRDHTVRLPSTIEVTTDLCDLFAVLNLKDAEGKSFRMKGFASGLGDERIQWVGICHFMEQKHISLFDLWNDIQDLSKGPMEKKVEALAPAASEVERLQIGGIMFPPNLPWTLRPTASGRHSFDLFDKEETPIARSLSLKVGKWLADEANLATIEDAE